MMARDRDSAIRTAKIKRLVADGRYRVDPVAVADAMIRRGNWVLCVHQGPPWIVYLPRGESDGRS
jgi:hypothetical protein